MPSPNVEISLGSHHPDTNGEMMNRSKAANIVAPKRMLQNFCTKRLLFWVNDQTTNSPPSGANSHLSRFVAFEIDSVLLPHRTVRQHLQEIDQVPDILRV